MDKTLNSIFYKNNLTPEQPMIYTLGGVLLSGNVFFLKDEKKNYIFTLFENLGNLSPTFYEWMDIQKGKGGDNPSQEGFTMALSPW